MAKAGHLDLLVFRAETLEGFMAFVDQVEVPIQVQHESLSGAVYLTLTLSQRTVTAIKAYHPDFTEMKTLNEKADLYMLMYEVK